MSRFSQSKSLGATGSSTMEFQVIEMKDGTREEVYVTHVTDPEHFYVQLTRCSADLDKLMGDLGSVYGDMGSGEGGLGRLTLGQPCVAQFSEDLEWYRAKVTGILKSGLVEVMFVDYGNSECVDHDKVKEIGSEFMHQPGMALLCGLTGVTTTQGFWSPEHTAQFEDHVLDQTLQAVFRGFKLGNEVLSVELESPQGKNINREFGSSTNTSCIEEMSVSRSCTVKVGQGSSDIQVSLNFKSDQPRSADHVRNAVPRVPAHLVKQSSFPAIDVKLQSEADVFLSWVENPEALWVQFASREVELNEITDKVQEIYTSGNTTSVRSIVPGMAVVTQFLEDEAWYRAVVQKMKGKKVEVLFVDFGNSDLVSADSLKEASSQIINRPMQAVLCNLTGICPLQSGEWSADAKSILEDIAKDGATCKFLSFSNGSYAVKLQVKGEDVSSELVAAGVAKKLETSPRANKVASVLKFSTMQPLQVRDVKAGFVSHVESLDSFWCQLNLPQLDSLMEELEGFYSQGNGIQLPKPQVGEACVAKFSEDLAWYRASVQEIKADGINVRFVDYGNSEATKASNVCSIGANFLSLPIQAVHCKLALSTPGSDEVIDSFHELVMEKEIQLKVLFVQGDVHVVDVLESGKSVTDKMYSLYPVLKGATESGASRPPASQRLSYLQETWPVGKTDKVFVSFTETPNKFYVHLSHIDSELNAIKEKLTSLYGDGTCQALQNAQVGQPCVALYSEDGAWYRGRVVKVERTQLSVQFVDYGNADLVASNDVKGVMPQLLSPAPLAMECCLEDGEPSGGEWTDDGIAYFETLTVEKELTCVFKADRKVALSVDGENVLEKMKAKGFVKGSSAASNSDTVLNLIYNPQVVPVQPNSAYVTHTDDNGTCYVQLASAEDLLTELSERLQELYNSASTTPLNTVSIGLACCAKFSEDGAWYRAAVEKVLAGKVLVRFVDFGNTDTVSLADVKTLQVDFFSVPPLAFQCKLPGVGPQVQKFADLTMDKEVTVKFKTQVAPFDVEMKLGSRSVTDLIAEEPKSPPRQSFAPLPASPQQKEEQPVQKKSFAPPPSDSSWDSPPQQKAFGSRPKKETSPPQWKPTRQESQPMGKPSFQNEKPRQRAPFGSPLNKVEPPEKPTLETIPVKEQVFTPQTVPGDMRACISHVENDDVFVQQVKDLNTILAFSTKIKKLPVVEVMLSVGLACGGLFSLDGTWYRAQVTSITNNKAAITFVDFGNTDVVDVNKLKQLSRELLQVPPFAFRCRVNGIPRLTPELTEILSQEVADKELQVKFATQNAPYNVTMTTDSGKDVVEILCPSKFPDQTAEKQVFPGVVSNIATDGTFFVQLLKDQTPIRKLEDELKSVYAKGTIDNPQSLMIGKPCCARFPDDQTWQRGMIKNIEGNVEVHFVDLGVTETLKSAFVQSLPRRFVLIPPFAYLCILKDFTSWTEDQRDKFISVTDGKTMNIEFMSQKVPFQVEMTRSVGLELMGDKPDVRKVSLSSGGSSHAEPEKQTLAVLADQRAPETDTGYVSYVDSNGTFYVQLSSEEEKLTEVTDALQEEYGETNGERVFGLSVGDICCAKFSEDDSWYRAIVTEITDDHITVRFLDYGNTDILPIERIAVLTSKNLSIPALCYRCTLDGVNTWDDMLVEKFDDTVKEKTLTITFQTESDPYCVELVQEEGEKLTDILADAIADVAHSAAQGGFKQTNFAPGDKVEVYVSHIDSKLNIWIQTVSTADELAEIGDRISEGYESTTDSPSTDWMKEGCAVVAKYSEDEHWYRGYLLSVGEDACKVHFVDYGNADEVNKKNIYTIKEDHSKLAAQAVSCKLDKLLVLEDKEDAAMDALYELTTDKALSLEIAGKAADRNVRYSVILWDGETDVRDKLVKDSLCVIEKDQIGPGGDGPNKTSMKQEESETVSTEIELSSAVADHPEVEPSSATPDHPEGNAASVVPSPFSVIELKQGQRISVHILHTENPSDFYIQAESSKHNLDGLMETMYEFYNDLAEGDMVIGTVQPGQICASMFGEDGSWYRGKICDIVEDKCRVFYVDYGNVERIACTDIRQLAEQFSTLPAQAVRCSLAGVRTKDEVWSQEAIDTFSELTADKTLIMDILTVDENGSCTVHLLHMGLAVNQVLLDKQLGVEAATPVPVSRHVKRIFSDTSDSSTPTPLKMDDLTNVEEEEVPTETIGLLPSSLDVGEESDIVMCQVNSPGNFYCQLAANIPALTHLAERLQLAYSAVQTSDSLKLSEINVGNYCVARLQKDGQFVRSKVLSLQNDEVSVELADLGREEKVTVGDLFKLKPEFTQEPRYSLRCCLSELAAPGGEWSEECCSRFKELVNDKEVKVKVTSNLDNSCVEAEILSSGRSMRQVLIDENMAVEEEDLSVIQQRIEKLVEPIVDTSEKYKQTVTTTKNEDGFEYLNLQVEKEYTTEIDRDHILDEFILNLTEVTKQVESMVKEITAYMADEDTATMKGDWQPVIGRPCLVQKEDEVQWYRGKVVKREGSGYKVYFVDHREMSVCDEEQMFPLPEQFLKVPVNGFKCQLADVAPIDGKWSNEAMTHFSDFTSNMHLSAFLVSESEEGIHYMRLHDMDDFGSATINRQLVDMGCAMALPGSLVEMELQMESTKNKPEVIEEMEQSFHDVSYHRENSLGDESDAECERDPELEDTLETPGHCEADETKYNTEACNRTVEAVDTPTATAAEEYSQQICSDIVSDLVTDCKDMPSVKGQQICHEIVEEIMNVSVDQTARSEVTDDTEETEDEPCDQITSTHIVDDAVDMNKPCDQSSATGIVDDAEDINAPCDQSSGTGAIDDAEDINKSCVQSPVTGAADIVKETNESCDRITSTDAFDVVEDINEPCCRSSTTGAVDDAEVMNESCDQGPVTSAADIVEDTKDSCDQITGTDNVDIVEGIKDVSCDKSSVDVDDDVSCDQIASTKAVDDVEYKKNVSFEESSRTSDSEDTQNVIVNQNSNTHDDVVDFTSDISCDQNSKNVDFSAAEDRKHMSCDQNLKIETADVAENMYVHENSGVETVPDDAEEKEDVSCDQNSSVIEAIADAEDAEKPECEGKTTKHQSDDDEAESDQRPEKSVDGCDQKSSPSEDSDVADLPQAEKLEKSDENPESEVVVGVWKQEVRAERNHMQQQQEQEDEGVESDDAPECEKDEFFEASDGAPAEEKSVLSDNE